MKSRILLVLLAVGVASLAIAQTPESTQSASPTSNQYRIRIAEPMEGSTVTGSTVSIVLVAPPPASEGTSVSVEERKDALRPTFQIWVDGKDYGNLPSNQNVFTASDLTPGPHTIVVAAKQQRGGADRPQGAEVHDRRGRGGHFSAFGHHHDGGSRASSARPGSGRPGARSPRDDG